jgi:hypothetical protein
MSPSVCDIIHWSHQLLSEVLTAGDCAIDLTAGRGNDLLWLTEQVASNAAGKVVAFDVQRESISSCVSLLEQHQLRFETIEAQQSVMPGGISLVHGCHSQWPDLGQQRPQGVIANFGYLPGGDHRLITDPQTTVAALEQAASALAVGGRMALVLYTGHPGAEQECQAIEAFCAELPVRQWHIIRLQTVNRNKAPYLLGLEKIKENQSSCQIPRD